MWEFLFRPFRRQSDSRPDEALSELNQTRHRLVILVLISTYVFAANFSLEPRPMLSPGAVLVLSYFAFYGPAALALHLAVRRWPGHYPFRRVLAMVLDYFSLGLSIVLERITLMPLFMVIVWITLGYGMRYRAVYLHLAMAIAMIAIASVLALIPWSAQTPYLALTLILITLAVPYYALWLLGRIETARAEAEAANLAKSRMLAQASHDLRQPIHAMGLLITSLQQTRLSADQLEIIERIDRSLQGVARLFRSLLDLSTLDSGSIKPQLEPVDLGELLYEVMLQNLQQAEWDGTELRLVECRAVVMTDRNLMTAMVQNLVSNALKFSKGRTVLIGCRKRGGTFTVEVWDQGIGIGPEHHDRVFEEFYQIRERGDRDVQGVGLGLSILTRMAGLLGLSVTLRSEPGRGSRFAISGIPQASTEAPPPAALPRLEQDWSPLFGLRVVLVEDDDDVLTATAQLLRGWRCEVETFLALPAYRQDCDVIVTDFDLGQGQTGADVISAIRSRAGRHIPAIVITGHDGSYIAEEIDDPAVAVLRKPLRPAELRSALAAIRTD